MKGLRTAAIIVIVAVSLLLFHRFNANITGFFSIGDQFPHSPYLEDQKLFLRTGGVGYDGQFFLTIALDPLLKNKDSIKALDNPRYRYRRILYPIAGYVLSAGRRSIIPYALLAINTACLIALAGIVSRYFKDNIRHNLIGLIALGNVGLWISLYYGTADLLATTFLAGAFLSWKDQKPFMLALCLSLACLTRETILLITAVFILAAIYERKTAALKHLAWCWLPAALWNLYVLCRLPNTADLVGIENMGLPFAGIAEKLRQLCAANYHLDQYSFVLLILTLCVLVIQSRGLFKKAKILCGSIILYFCIFVLSKYALVNIFINYNRVFADVYLLLLLSMSIQPRRIKSFLLAGSCIQAFLFVIKHAF